MLPCGSVPIQIQKNTNTQVKLRALSLSIANSDESERIAEPYRMSMKCELKGTAQVSLPQTAPSGTKKIIVLLPRETAHIYIGLRKITLRSLFQRKKLFPLHLEAPEKANSTSNAYYFPEMLSGLEVSEKFPVKSTLLLPAGSYQLELHGTAKKVRLTDSSQRKTLKLATLTGKAQTASADGASKKNSYTLNQKAHLKFGVAYLVFPGEHSLMFDGNDRVYKKNISEQESAAEFFANSVTIMQKCPPWELECKHHKKFALFSTGARYPFARGTSEALLYFIKDANIEISNLGTFELRKKLDKTKEVTIEPVGTVEIELAVSKHRFLQTEFIRIEPSQKDFSGASFDLSIHKKNRFTLFTGRYVLGHYIYNRSSKKRKRLEIPIVVSQKKNRTISVKVFDRTTSSASSNTAGNKNKQTKNERLKIF
jgi:hypothetical protein